MSESNHKLFLKMAEDRERVEWATSSFMELLTEHLSTIINEAPSRRCACTASEFLIGTVISVMLGKMKGSMSDDKFKDFKKYIELQTEIEKGHFESDTKGFKSEIEELEKICKSIMEALKNR